MKYILFILIIFCILIAPYFPRTASVLAAIIGLYIGDRA